VPPADVQEHAMTARPRRSVLYMPGANTRALEKAKTIPADALILDLEDSVAPEAKTTARQQVAAAVTAGGYGRREVAIRVNGIDTPWFEEDVAAAASAGPDAIVVPKVSSPDDLDAVARMLKRVAAPEKVRVWAMVETPLAMLDTAAIAKAGRVFPACRMDVLVVGTNDLAKETRAVLEPGRAVFLPWLMTCIAAARAWGLDILDGAWNDFRDIEGLRTECRQAKSMGFDGKTLIHPDQVAIANETFAPTQEEVALASRIVAAFEKPENAGKGVISLDGRMVELLHAEMAKRTIAIAEAIARGA
jgi:citrate lyase subunit beta / citryl-CoA lyase